MQCAERSCLASYEWLGNPDDPALVTLATDRGWKLLETGWRCPRHAPVKAGDLDFPAPNHFDPSKRGFDPS